MPLDLTLLLPGLAWPGVPAVLQDLNTPTLAWVCGRGRHRKDSRTLDAHYAAFSARTWPLPVAALTAHYDNLPLTRYLRADPVHLRAERTHLVLADSGIFALSQDEADALVSTLNAYFTEEGLIFYAPHPDRWYVQLSEVSDTQFSPLESVIGESIDAHLPHGTDAMRWHQRMNEVQMLFFEHPVNLAREARGEPIVNSVWFWGAGDLPSPKPMHLAALWADDVLLRALAAVDGVPHAHAPARYHAWHPVSGQVVIELDTLRGAAQYQDAWGWREALLALENTWFAPLCAALRARELARLHLIAPGAWRLELHARDVWKCWRRPRSLNAMV